METPDVSPGAKDSATLAKADLGLLGRVRLKLAGPVLLLGMLLMPPEIREATSNLTVTDEEE